MTTRGSRRLCPDLRCFMVGTVGGGSSRLMGGGCSSGEDGATMGAARARGDETEEGVDDRV